ncbi:MAG: SRPBCC family protein [Myxococcota bacterium]
MAWMEGTHEETRTLPLPADVAAAHFANPERILAATKGLESHEVEGHTIHFILEEEDHGVVKFKADYRCTYTLDGTTVRWAPTGEGNLQQSGEATFTPNDDGGCTLHYQESLKIDLPVASMMAPMLKPLLGPLVAKEIAAYLDRIVGSLPTG